MKHADERIPALLKIPAVGRFLSLEPLLGPVNIRGHVLGFNAGDPAKCQCGHGHGFTRCPNTGGVAVACHKCDCKAFSRVRGNGIHWMIIGGESGHGARPCNVEWIRSLVEQGKAAGVATFVKQLGARPVAVSQGCDTESYKIQESIFICGFTHPKGGDPAEWPEDIRVREFPEGLQ